MLIRFSFRNFKSVGEEPVTLDLVSSAKIRSLPNHICPSSAKAKILRNAVIYGGNAAGKSTITQAFSFMKNAVTQGFLPQKGIKRFCKCGAGYAEKESTFDIQFQVDGEAYDYGFSCILSKLQITSEWLYKLGNKSKLLFQREGTSTINCEGVDSALKAAGLENDITRLKIYAEDFIQDMKDSVNSGLFLSTISRGRSFDETSPLSIFRKVFAWFDSGLVPVGTDQHHTSTEFYADGKTLDQVAEVLASFDTGVADIVKKEISFDEMHRYVPREVILTLKSVLKDNIPESDDSKFALTIRSNDSFLGVEREGAAEPIVTILKIKHDGSVFDFDFEEESDGTRRLFDFMDLLFTKSKDKAFIIDELNRCFHPMLTQQLVELFNEVHSGDDCQLIFTTHENDIMDYRYFRRDEIWFVERDAKGYTHLFSLDEFASTDARSDARLNKKYLEGRYGGVPVFSKTRALAALGVD